MVLIGFYLNGILKNIKSERRTASDESMKGGDADKQGDRPRWRRYITVFGKETEGTAAVEGWKKWV
jgi:hypothetical protein